MSVLRLVLGFAVIALLLAGPARADLRADLLEALGQQKTEAEARALENEIWQVWLQGPSEEATELVARAMERRRWRDFAGALEHLNKAVDMAPDWAEAWNQRAFIYFLQEKYAKSLADLDRAIELEPMHFAALAGKAQILMRQGRARLAQKILRKAVEIHPFLRERALLIEIPGEDI